MVATYSVLSVETMTRNNFTFLSLRNPRSLTNLPCCASVALTSVGQCVCMAHHHHYHRLNGSLSRDSSRPCSTTQLLPLASWRHTSYPSTLILNGNCLGATAWALHRAFKHLLNMIKLTVAITVWVVQAVINHPKLFSAGMNVQATNQTNASNDAVFVTTILSPDQFNRLAKTLVQHRVIKNKIPRRVWRN